MKVVVENLSKKYHDRLALAPTSFEVESGQIFGMIGPDGAGKTTLWRMLATLLLPDTGWAKLGDNHIVDDYLKLRRVIGYMPGKFSLYQDLSIEENLRFFASVFGVKWNEQQGVLDDIYRQIAPFKTRRAGKLSGGMKQKLALCCAMIHRPEILILDEPTTGVDPVSRKEFWQALKTLEKEGLTILVSTPYMDEATLCSKVALIQNGVVLESGSPVALCDSLQNRILAVRCRDLYDDLLRLRTLSFIEDCYPYGDEIHIRLPIDLTGAQAQGMLAEAFQAWNQSIPEMRLVKPSIEDKFLTLAHKSMSYG